MKLSARRTKFVDEYILDANSSAAARRAGYAVVGARVTGHRLLTDANVKAAIALKRQEMAQQYEINKHGVVSELLAAVEIARDRLDSGNMIRAWCEIAKILGIYAPEKIKVEAYAENEVLEAKFVAMSDYELMAIARGHTLPQASI